MHMYMHMHMHVHVYMFTPATKASRRSIPTAPTRIIIISVTIESCAPSG